MGRKRNGMKERKTPLFRRVLCLLLILALFASSSLLAFADGADSAPVEGGIEITPEYAEEVRRMRGSILDDDELAAMIDTYLAEHKLDPEKVSIGYCYLDTGDEYYYRPDDWYYAASLYKVPLMMLVAERVSGGMLDQDGDMDGLPINLAEEYILTFSNNDYAHRVRDYLGGDKVWREDIKQYADFGDDYYSSDFVDYAYFSARYMTKCFETLYYHEQNFPNIIDCLLKADPTHYFRLSTEMQAIPIAQKYGSFYDDWGKIWNNTAGIIYTDHPFVLTIMTLSAMNWEKAVSDLAILMTDYTRSLDERYDSYVAEQEAKEAERKAEAEQAAAEEAEQQAAVQAQQQAEQAAVRERETRRANTGKLAVIVGVAAALLAAVVIILSIVTSRRNKRARYEAYRRRYEEELRRERESERAGAQRPGTQRSSGKHEAGKHTTGQHRTRR